MLQVYTYPSSACFFDALCRFIPSTAKAVVRVDSAAPQLPPSVSDPQPDIPLGGLADDGSGRPLSPSDFVVYSRNSHKSRASGPSHGLALIISNETFDASARLSQRICTPYDNKRLKDTLTGIGYRVVIRKNQTGREMNALFETIKVNSPGELHIKNEDDSFICFISSHGDWDSVKNTDKIYGRDKGSLYLQEVVYDKLNAIVCRHLRGKPKLFFVQACRGAQVGRIADDGGTKVDPVPRLPRESDFFLSYSTAPETKAFRFDPNRPQPEGTAVDISDDDHYDSFKIGSFYITELCVALKRFAGKLDLFNIILSVHQTLEATDKNLFQLGSTTTRQCPHLTTSLRGPIFFFDEAEALFRDHMKRCLK